MKSWRLLINTKSRRFLARTAVRTVGRNFQDVPYRNLSYGALGACRNEEESEQPRQSRGLRGPHVLGLVSLGLVLCSGRKGIRKTLTAHHDVTTIYKTPTR